MIFGTSITAILLGLILCVLNFFGEINIGYFWATLPIWIGLVANVLFYIFGFIYNWTHGYFKDPESAYKDMF